MQGIFFPFVFRESYMAPSCYRTKNNLELQTSSLPLLNTGRDYRLVPLHLVYVVLRTELRMEPLGLGKSLPTELHSLPSVEILNDII